ncbi:MAG: acyl-CoA reductase [Bacteroidetes bacterium]|nr:acyl-CoA reductase [Bacteroidota bacterium]
MNLDDRIAAFCELGAKLKTQVETWARNDDDCEDNFLETMRLSESRNPWFDKKNLISSLSAWSDNLTKKELNNWINPYADLIRKQNKIVVVGVVAAGNIPMVSFHDFVSILLTGNRFRGKLAKSDNSLLPYVIKELLKIEPRLSDRIDITDDHLEGFDAVIATGSDNSARYFDYYFGKYPNVIRKNRNAIAVIEGTESPEEMMNLGNDIFQYYGLGCRNVSKLLVPVNYNLDRFFEGIYPFADVIHHNKYGNNYDYNRTIFLMNEEKFLDNGFVLLKEDEGIASPIATLYFERYDGNSALDEILTRHQDELQCVSSKMQINENTVNLGRTQQPELFDYADGINTIEFLCDLNS